MENIKAKIQGILLNCSQKSVIGWAVEEDDFEHVAEEIVEKLFIGGVIESAFIEIFDKAACIQHWHNTGKNDEGMVVSSEKVHELWDELEKYRDFRHSL